MADVDHNAQNYIDELDSSSDSDGNSGTANATVNTSVKALTSNFAAMNVQRKLTPRRLCVVCGLRPIYSNNGKTYPTCGLTCADALKKSGTMCVVCGVKPPYSKNGKNYPSCGLACAAKLDARNMCVVCGLKRKYSQNGKSYPTCGTTCGSQLCVVCNKKPVCYSPGTAPFVTCGLTCLEKLCDGKADPTQCDYCHRRPKLKSYPHCGKTCASKAKQACLMCRARPTMGKYHFCGKTCRQISLKATPRLCNVPKGHVTWEMVEKKFQAGWKDASRPCPPLLHVYKIVESDAFHQAYTSYKNQVGNEQFLYHGTKRLCQLGEGTTTVCASAGCAACNILNTSYNVAFARATGCFGAGIYTSSAVNLSEWFLGRAAGKTGAMFLNKVALGKPYPVTAFYQATSQPPGHDSVIYKEGAPDNETIVYTNNAIRPVFFLVF